MKDKKGETMTLFHDTQCKVSDWFDQDCHQIFCKTVRSGDILELRTTKCSHWGIAVRVAQPSSPKAKSKPNKPAKIPPDEIMVYHLIHSSKSRGQVGQFSLEDFWQPECRMRINNTVNGSGMYGSARIINKTDVLQNACTAHSSTQLKWQTCADFIRWSSEEIVDDNASNASNASSTTSVSSTASH